MPLFWPKSSSANGEPHTGKNSSFGRIYTQAGAGDFQCVWITTHRTRNAMESQFGNRVAMQRVGRASRRRIDRH
jgi:hypothetical protein